MLPGSGAGATTGHTGVGLPSRARAPADVAPSATVVGLDFLTGADFFGLGDVLPGKVVVAGLGATLDVSCAAPDDDADKFIAEINSATVRRRFLLGVNTNQD